MKARWAETSWSRPLAEGVLVLTLALLALAAVVCVAAQVANIGFPYQIDYGEAPLVDQASRLAAGESIYQPDLAVPPYTISNYPPVYVATLAAFVPVAGAAFWPGRLVSAAAALLSAGFIGLIVWTATRDRVAAAMAGLFLLAWPIVVLWSGLARIDLLALALSLAGLWVLVRSPASWGGLLGGGALLVAAIYTRQSYGLAAPAAACIWIWSTCGFRRALALGLFMAGTAAAIFAGFTVLTNGGFYLHIVAANVNAFNWQTVRYQAQYVWDLGGLLLTLGVGSLALIRRWNPLYALAAPYLVGATLSALTIGKVGSNVNYLLELCAALALVVGVVVAAAHRTGALGPARAALYAVLAWEAATLLGGTFTRFPGETPQRLRERAELRQLERLVAEAQGPVLADEQMGMVTLAGKRLALQPFEMTQLAAAGLWDQQPLLDQIRGGAFDLIILYDRPWLQERWTPEMFTAIDQAYRLSDVIADNRVYRPYRVEPSGAAVACPGAPWPLPTAADLGLRWEQGALTLFGHGLPDTVDVSAVDAGAVRLFSDRPGAVAIRFADPVTPDAQVWMLVDGLADGSGAVSFVSDELADGATVAAGTILGAQGSWSGRPQFAMWVHAQIKLVRATSTGDLPDPIQPDQILDPSPYFGLKLPADGSGVRALACRQP